MASVRGAGIGADRVVVAEVGHEELLEGNTLRRSRRTRVSTLICRSRAWSPSNSSMSHQTGSFSSSHLILSSTPRLVSMTVPPWEKSEVKMRRPVRSNRHGGLAAGDDVRGQAPDVVDGASGCIVPSEYGVESGIAVRAGAVGYDDLDVSDGGVEPGHGFVAAAGGVDVPDVGDGVLGLDADDGAEAEAVGVLVLPLRELGDRHVAPDIVGVGAPFALLPGTFVLEAGGDGLGDLKALFGGELVFGEGGAGRGLHLLPLGFGWGVGRGGRSGPLGGLSKEGAVSRPIEKK